MPRGRPRKKPAQVQGSSPVEQATAVLEKSESLYDVTDLKLYWHGALPETDPFKIAVPTHEGSIESPVTGEFVKNVGGFTSKRLWHNPPDPEAGPQWIGKCRWYQQLDVSSLSFPAWTDEVASQVGTSNTNRMPWPGSVSLLTPERIQKVLKEMDDFVVRIGDGSTYVPKEDWHTVKSQIVSIINLKHGHKPDDLSDADWRAYKMNGQTSPEKERRRKYDMPLANFVYLVPLDVDTNIAASEYYTLVPSFHKFFDNPPPMLADALKK